MMVFKASPLYSVLTATFFTLAAPSALNAQEQRPTAAVTEAGEFHLVEHGVRGCRFLQVDQKSDMHSAFMVTSRVEKNGVGFGVGDILFLSRNGDVFVAREGSDIENLSNPDWVFDEHVADALLKSATSLAAICPLEKAAYRPGSDKAAPSSRHAL